jgi:hypothetical protein
VVTLEGTVEFWSQFDDAVRAIRNLAGVRDVNNLLHVEPVHAAQTVRGAMEKALERHALHAANGVKVAIAERHGRSEGRSFFVGGTRCGGARRARHRRRPKG